MNTFCNSAICYKASIVLKDYVFLNDGPYVCERKELLPRVYLIYQINCKFLREYCQRAMLYIDCALALQLHIENGKILNTNEHKYLMLNKSLSGHQLEINQHLLEDDKKLDSAIAR